MDQLMSLCLAFDDQSANSLAQGDNVTTRPVFASCDPDECIRPEAQSLAALPSDGVEFDPGATGPPGAQ